MIGMSHGILSYNIEGGALLEGHRSDGLYRCPIRISIHDDNDNDDDNCITGSAVTLLSIYLFF